MPYQPEAKLKTEIREYLNYRGIYYDNIAAGPYSRPGSPDMVVCYRGHYVALEAKTDTGTLSSIQRVRQSQILSNGGHYEVVRSLSDVIDILGRIDNGPYRR